MNYTGGIADYCTAYTQDTTNYDYFLYDTPPLTGQLTVTGPDGTQVASLAVSEASAQAPLSVSGSGNQLSLSGTSSNWMTNTTNNDGTFTYAAGSANGQANDSFSGTTGSSFNLPQSLMNIYVPPINNPSLVGGQQTFQNIYYGGPDSIIFSYTCPSVGALGYESDFQGTFTFYAATPGTYMVVGFATLNDATGTKGGPPSAYTDTMTSYEYQYNIATGNNNLIGATGWSSMGSVGWMIINSITTRGPGLPTGTLTATKDSSGAAGVNLTWTITPPTSTSNSTTMTTTPYSLPAIWTAPPGGGGGGDPTPPPAPTE